MLNLLSSHPKKSASHGSLAEYAVVHDVLVEEEGSAWAGAIRRSSTKSSSKTKSSTKSTPSSPTKRSSSLSSRFSFSSGGKKENGQDKIPVSVASGSTKRRSLRPMLDVNKWRSSTGASHQGTLVEGRVSSMPAGAERWSDTDRYMFRTSGPSVPSSVLHSELRIPASQKTGSSKSVVSSITGSEGISTANWLTSKGAFPPSPLMRRHTMVAPSPSDVQKHWKKSQK